MKPVFDAGMFRFPSLGKVSPKSLDNLNPKQRKAVFRFPSLGKVSPKVNENEVLTDAKGKSFDSLRSGKCLQRPKQENPDIVIGGKFRFPSLGKVSPKVLNWNVLPEMEDEFRFPSLGKVSPKPHGFR